MAFTKEAITTSDLSFIASAHLKAFVLTSQILKNHQVNVPSDYTTKGNTVTINFSK